MQVCHITSLGEAMTEDEVDRCRCDRATFHYDDGGNVYMIQHGITEKEVGKFQGRLMALYYRRFRFDPTKRRR